MSLSDYPTAIDTAWVQVIRQIQRGDGTVHVTSDLFLLPS